MRAVAVKQFRGPAELVEVPRPSIGPSELGVRIEAAGMNPFDWKIADGVMDGVRPHVFPLVLGVDGCGTVEAVGSAVRHFRVGDRLVGSFLHTPVGVGTYAEHTAVPETNCLVVVPPALTSTMAAALPTAGMTALQSLDLIHAAPGGRVLIVGASGGIGSFAVQLARARGLVVAAVARPASHARLRSLGVSVAIEPESFEAPELREFAGEARLDGLLDVSSNPASFARWVRWLRPGGVAVSTIGAARPAEGIQAISIDMQPRSDDLGRLITEIERDHLHVPVERTIGLDEAPQAVQESRSGKAAGKTVILP